MARTSRTSFAAFAALALFAAGAVYAASIEAEPRKDYGRIRFGFSAPTVLHTSTRGTQATLTFDKPLDASTESIAENLPDYVKGSSLSVDKKTLTLTLAKPYRIRQFTSGNKVGLDLIDRGDTTSKLTETTKESPKEKTADAAILTTKKTADTAPAKPIRPAAKTVEKPKPVTKLVAVAKPEPKPTPKPAAKPEPKPEPMLTTKKAPAPETRTTPAPSAVEEAAHTSKPPAQKPTAAPAPKAPAQPAPTVKEAAAKPSPETKPVTASPPFAVGVKSSAAQTDLYFPWRERTASAVFKRERDVWIVFSRFADVDAKQLLTKLPKNIVQVTQYADHENTILRLATDGTLNPKIVPLAKGFGWQVSLIQTTSTPAQDVSLNVDSLESTERLLLGLFDISPTLRFFDPTVGDQLIVIPSYEAGRGVTATKNFPQLSLLATAQGVAVVSRMPDLHVNQNRSGTILSADGGLAVSENLPVLANKAPIAGNATSTGVALPYDQWYVPAGKFRETQAERLHAVAVADTVGKPEALFELVKLYLSYGMGPEALGVLSLLRNQYSEYYITNKLALLSGAANILANHMDTAAADLAAPELNELEEAVLWRQVAALYTPATIDVQKLQAEAATKKSDSAANSPNAAPTAEAAAAVTASKPSFQFLKYSRSYIRFYPPRIRQRLASIAADAYLADGQEEKALAVYDTLMRDDLLAPLRHEAEFVLGAVAAKKGEVDQAYDAFDRVAGQIQDPRSAARARFAKALLYYQKGKMGADEASEIIEQARMGWRSDAIEREMLHQLVNIYTESKRYDEVLRTQKTILDAFPGDPEVLSITGDMSTLFHRVFLEGLADEMEPLKALSLFYEFRDLTPLGDDGDTMIQKLADRIAALDLLDRAAGLLDNQIKFRAKGEARSRIGARLALLHLLNKNPQEALNVLQVTNFGGNSTDLQTTRLQLMAEALTKLDKNEEALGVLYNDVTPAGAQLRLDILWAMKDWPNIAGRAEDILSARPNLTDPLTLKETEVLLKLALAYTFEGDYNQLRYLRDYYSGLIPDTGYKQIFDYITNDTTPLDPEDFNLLAQQINRTEGFLDAFKSKIAAGKLSEAVK